MKNFESVKEMLNWLIDNEGEILSDSYGRRWMYKYFDFYFGDINEEIKECIDCLHLYKTL